MPASERAAASEAGPGALPKPPGQTITTVSGERLKDAPAFTVEELLQESPNFRLWRGDQINGARYGVESGSFGYVNNYAIVGGRNERAEGTAFMSDVRGDGYISHSSFNTQTFNALGTYSPTPDDRITFKAIENRLSTNLSVRLSLNQFQTNPFQRGCINAAIAAPGCGTVALFANGFSAPTVPQTAEEAALGRRDLRHRWDHDFDSAHGDRQGPAQQASRATAARVALMSAACHIRPPIGDIKIPCLSSNVSTASRALSARRPHDTHS